MLYEQITYESANLVATITLNRPDKLNAWTQKMEEEVVAAVRAAATDDQVRVIILTGAGKGFCAGADMSLLSAISQESAPRAGRFLMDNEIGSDVPVEFRKKHAWFLSVPKPIIAATSMDRPWGWASSFRCIATSVSRRRKRDFQRSFRNAGWWASTEWLGCCHG